MDEFEILLQSAEKAVEALDLYGFEGDDAAASEMLADVWLTLEAQGKDWASLQIAE